MKNSKSLSIILAIIAVVFVVMGAINTSLSIKSYNEYQEGIKSYNQFADAEGTLIGDYAAKLAAKAYSGSETAKVIKKEMYRHFAMASVFILVGIIFFANALLQFTKKKE